MKKYLCSITVLCSVLLFCLSASAHEFIVKPVQLNTSVGHQLPFSVVSSHVFMISEEVEPIDQVTTSLIKGDSRTDLALKKNDTLLTLDGSVKLEKEGTSILAGHRNGIIWTQTTTGWKEASKKDCTGVISSGKYEKFCKTLVNSGKPDEGYKQVIGQKLEIVPVSNPAEAAPGKEMVFKILYDGKPLSTKVCATYDGFMNNPNTYAYTTETDAKGLARVKITNSGTWMVRVEKINNKETADYDKQVTRSILVFGVI